jgi:type II secretory pathway predicted ATPase ExeA
MDSVPFELTHWPFAAISSVAHYQPTRPCESARIQLRGALERQAGIGLLLGPAGTGKTTVLRRMAAELASEYRVVMVPGCHPEFTRRELLKTILFELELPFREGTTAELRLSLIEFLLSDAAKPSPLMLLVDDAHQLSPGLLEELRMLSDVQADGRGRVGLVLAGLNRLEETLAHVDLEPLNQRVAARAYVRALGYDDSLEYVRGAFRSAGGNPDAVFSHDALVSLYHASAGVPRLINQLADQALHLASHNGNGHIDRPLVENAWAEQQQLPASWSERRTSEPAAAAAIEFGELPQDGSARTVDGESFVEYGPLGESDPVEAAAVETEEPTVAVVEVESIVEEELVAEIDAIDEVEADSEELIASESEVVAESKALVPVVETVRRTAFSEWQVFDRYTRINPREARAAFTLDRLQEVMRQIDAMVAEARAQEEAAQTEAERLAAERVAIEVEPVAEAEPVIEGSLETEPVELVAEAAITAETVLEPEGELASADAVLVDDVPEAELLPTQPWLAALAAEAEGIDGSTYFEHLQLIGSPSEGSPMVVILTQPIDLVTMPLEPQDEILRIDGAERLPAPGRPVRPADFRHMFAQLMHGAEDN